jgi:serine/threonine-protein kinase
MDSATETWCTRWSNDVTERYDPDSGALVGGRYRLEAPIGRGGMGTVWTARHERLGTRVAVKFLSRWRDRVACARFAWEARAAALLMHPHVVRVLDYGHHGSAPYIVMEHLRGEDLGRRLDRRRRLSPGETLPLVEQLSDALSGLARVGILHRDIKPSNLFLATYGEREVLKLLDFGIAKPVGVRAPLYTAHGTVMGSLQYMSPEQLQGERLDARTDLWSLAVVIFQMLTGRRPFRGGNAAMVRWRITTGPIPALRRVAPELPPALDAFFARAFSRDPARRFSSPGELAQAFRDALRAVLAPPADTPPPRDPSEDATTQLFLRPTRRSAAPPTAAPRRSAGWLWGACAGLGVVLAIACALA